MNQNVFGTTFVRKGVSGRTLKAMLNPIDKSIGVEMTYDDCNEVNGGIAITEAIGLTGTALSIACTAILFVDSNIKKFLNLGWRLALKIIRFFSDIASCISVM